MNECYNTRVWLTDKTFCILYSPNSSSSPDQSDVIPTISSYDLDDYPLQRTLIAILICVIALVGVVGNTFVVVAVGTFRKLRTVTNAFITSLAVCNFVTCFTSPYHVATILWASPPKSAIVCVAIACILISTQIVSLITLTLIAINRALLVRGRPRTVNLIYTKRNVALMIAASWILPASVVTLASAVGFATLGYNVKYKTCIVSSDRSEIASLVAGVVIGIPSLFIIVVCYTAIFVYSRDHHKQIRRSLSGETIREASKQLDERLKKTHRDGSLENTSSTNLQTPQRPKFKGDDNRNDVKANTNGNSSSGASTVKRRMTITEHAIVIRQTKITRNLFLIVCVFGLCVAPFCVAIILPNANAVIPWFAVLLLSNSAINPILYGVLHPQFRGVFVKLLLCNFRKSNPGQTSRISSFANSSPRKRESSF